MGRFCGHIPTSRRPTLRCLPIEDDSGGEEFGRIVVVGTYIASIAVGISVADISGKAIANLDYEKIVHHRTVFIGDTLHAETEILEMRESHSKPERGIIFVETKAYNQHDELVLTLRRHILIPKRK